MYAGLADVQNLGVPAQSIAQLTVAQTNEILQGSSDFADSFFRGRWGYAAVPLVTWDLAVTQAVASIAAYRMIRVRGLRSANNSDKELREGYNDAVEWLKGVQHQQIHPAVTLATANAPGGVQPNLVSTSVVNIMTGSTAPNRGW